MPAVDYNRLMQGIATGGYEIRFRDTFCIDFRSKLTDDETLGADDKSKFERVIQSIENYDKRLNSDRPPTASEMSGLVIQIKKACESLPSAYAGGAQAINDFFTQHCQSLLTLQKGIDNFSVGLRDVMAVDPLDIDQLNTLIERLGECREGAKHEIAQYPEAGRNSKEYESIKSAYENLDADLSKMVSCARLITSKISGVNSANGVEDLVSPEEIDDLRTISKNIQNPALRSQLGSLVDNLYRMNNAKAQSLETVYERIPELGSQNTSPEPSPRNNYGAAPQTPRSQGSDASASALPLTISAVSSSNPATVQPLPGSSIVPPPSTGASANPASVVSSSSTSSSTASSSAASVNDDAQIAASSSSSSGPSR